MRERKENFGFAWASQTTLSVTLIAISVILLALGLTQLEGARPEQAKNEGQHLTQTEQPNALGDCVGAEPARLLPAFAANYSCVSLGSVPGVPTNYGGLTLKYNDPNTFLIGGAANTSAGRIYQIGVIRDADMHITGFSGTAILYPNSGSTVGQFNDGIVFGPGDVLFVGRYPRNELEQTKPGNSAPDKVTSLSPLGVASSIGSIGFVPAGFPGAGQMKMVSYNGGGWYTAAFSPDGSGTYDIASVTLGPNVGGGPVGMTFVPPGSPVFPPNSALVAQYDLGKIMTAPLDENGDPILASQQNFIDQLSGAEGAFIDPITGDFLFSTYGSGNRIIRVAGFTSLATPTPTPTPTVTPSPTPTPTPGPSATPNPSATPTTGPPISGYNAWLRADAGTVLDASNHISTWQDQSGNGNHFTQPNPDQRPSLEAAGLGNRATVRFDGNNDSLLGVEAMNFGRPSTVFLVYEVFDYSSFAQGRILQNNNDSSWILYTGGFVSGGISVQNGGVGLNQPTVAAMTNTSTGTTIRINGSDWTQNPNASSGTPGRLNLAAGTGPGYPANCSVAEVIVYDRALSDAERQEVEAYLAGRYSLYQPRVATPVISPASQVVSAPTSVSMIVSTSGAEIRYTLDGSEPTAASPLYSAALSVAPGTTVRARAFKSGWLASYTAQAVYTASATIPVATNGLRMWLRADVGVTVNGAGAVERWEDLSGHGNHMLQSNPFQQPVLQSAGLGARATVRFDGNNDSLLGVEAMNFGRPSTVFLVYEVFDYASFAQGRILQNSADSSWILYTGGFASGGTSVQSGGVGLNQPTVAVMTNSLTGTTININGSDWTQNPNASSGTPGRLNLGAGTGPGYPANCSVAEVIVYDRALNDAERQEVEAYLAGRYTLYDTRVATPVINPPSQFVSANTNVTMSVSTSGAEIRYTLDGSEPAAASPLYSAALNVAPGTTVKARAFKSGQLASYIAQTVYTAGATVPIATNGLQMWLRADAGLTVNEAGVVERWEDLSGHGNHVLQNTPFQEPMLQSAGLGNRAAVRFDGEDDGLWGVEAMNFGRPSTVFVVYEKLSGGGYVLQNSAGGQWFVRSDGFYSDGWVRNDSPANNEEVVAVMTNSTTGTTVHVNGTDWTQNATFTTPEPGRLALGGGNGRNYDPLNCLVAEVIVYDRALGDAERQEVESYLTARYALTEPRAALPVASAASGTYFGAVDTTLSTATGAIIRFTTDGSDPVATSPAYTSALRFFSDTTLKARAFANGMSPSSVLEERYLVRQGLGVPRYWSGSAGGNGHYYRLAYYSYAISWDQAQAEALAMGGYLATLISAEENDFVFSAVAQDPHAWNNAEGPFLGGFQPPGSPEPSGGWQWVNNEGPFNFTAWAVGEPNNQGDEDVLQFRNHAASWNDRARTVQSGVRSFIVEFNDDPEFNVVADPAASPPVGTYDGDVAVTLESSTFDAIIHYTLDGQVPTETSATYQSPIMLSATTNIRARAYKAGMYPSQIVAFNYNIIPTLNPDLTVQNLGILGANPHSGSSVTLKWKEVNSGTAPAIGAYYDSVRVRNTTTGETLLDSIVSPDPAPSLGIGEFRDRQYTLTLPDGSRSVGALEFIVTADFLNSIYEGTPGGVAETNNSVSITVDSTLADYPDLKITSIVAPPSGLLEQSVQLSWTVKNDGPGTTTGGWHDQVYLSPDAFLGNDQALGSFFYTSPLAPGASVTRTELITLPATGTGTKYLIVVTNASHEVFELNFDNNALVSTQSTQVSTYGVSVTVSQNTFLGGTVITLTGTTFDLVTGALVGNAPVTVRITHNGTIRIIYVTSDATGHFQVTFTALPGEGGDYEVAADRPSVVGNVTQVQFSIIAMSVTPGQMAHRLLVGVAQTGHVDLRNLGTRPLTGIQANVVGAAANVSIQVNAPSELAPSASAPVTYTVSASNDSILANPGAQIRFLSAEGAAVILPLNIEVVSLAPRLSATPAALNAGMLRGSQRIVEFEISNTGGTPTGELTVALPSAPWLALVTPTQIPSLASGERATVDLALTPDADLPLGPYSGTLVISSAATNLTIPFQFVAVSDLIGDVHVTVVDEFTFFAEGAPKVAGATVTLTDPATNEIVRTGTTAENGELSFTGVREGYYYIESRAPEHNSHRATLLVTASQVTEVRVFLARELISYTWIVTPTEIEDHYIFVLDVQFATNVPAPVVTVEPASIDLSTLTDEVTQVNFTITNHGLIAAEHVNLSFEDDVVWQITPLAGYIGTLAAQQSVVVPVTFARLNPARPAGLPPPPPVAPSSAPSPSPTGHCQIGGSVGYDFQCGGTAQLRSTPIIAYNGNGECGPLGGNPPGSPPGGIGIPGLIQPPIGTTGQCQIPRLESQTVATVPADRKRMKVGVGEEVLITIKPPSAGAVTWLGPSAGGILEDKTTTSARFVAGSRTTPASVVGARTSNGEILTLSFSIVEPQSEEFIRSEDKTGSDPNFTPGDAGLTALIGIKVLPDDVSFTNVECIEIAGPPSNLGEVWKWYLRERGASALDHNTAPPSNAADAHWKKLNDNNEWQDVAGFGPISPENLADLQSGIAYWILDGFATSFDWQIPVRWRLKKAGRSTAANDFDGTLPNRTQTTTLHYDGRMIVHKFGVVVGDRSP
jgi:phage gp36-like protein